jgi:hypothetical protein
MANGVSESAAGLADRAPYRCGNCRSADLVGLGHRSDIPNKTALTGAVLPSTGAAQVPLSASATTYPPPCGPAFMQIVA